MAFKFANSQAQSSFTFVFLLLSFASPQPGSFAKFAHRANL
jgi:hypothetical protein